MIANLCDVKDDTVEVFIKQFRAAASAQQLGFKIEKNFDGLSPFIEEASHALEREYRTCVFDCQVPPKGKLNLVGDLHGSLVPLFFLVCCG